MTINKSLTNTTTEENHITAVRGVDLCNSNIYHCISLRYSFHHESVVYRRNESSRESLIQILDEALSIANSVEEEQQALVVATD